MRLLSVLLQTLQHLCITALVPTVHSKTALLQQNNNSARVPPWLRWQQRCHQASLAAPRILRKWRHGPVETRLPPGVAVALRDDVPGRARPNRARVRSAGEPEDEAAVKAEAIAIVAQAKKDIKLREEAGRDKKARRRTTSRPSSTRISSKLCGPPKAPEKPKEAPGPNRSAEGGGARPEATKKEAAAIVAAANKDYKQRLADREKAKTATAEDLQAMINAKLNISK